MLHLTIMQLIMLCIYKIILELFLYFSYLKLVLCWSQKGRQRMDLSGTLD